jgi:hypothetical protein
MKRKLLVVVLLAWVAPLSAHQRPAATDSHSSDCPYERARLAALTPAKSPAPPVVVVQGGSASALGIGRTPVFMP